VNVARRSIATAAAAHAERVKRLLDAGDRDIGGSSPMRSCLLGRRWGFNVIRTAVTKEAGSKVARSWQEVWPHRERRSRVFAPEARRSRRVVVDTEFGRQPHSWGFVAASARLQRGG
jgi:hypothetical protein